MRQHKPPQTTRRIIRVHIPPLAIPREDTHQPTWKKIAFVAGIGAITAWIASPSEPPAPDPGTNRRLDVLEALYAGARSTPHAQTRLALAAHAEARDTALLAEPDFEAFDELPNDDTQDAVNDDPPVRP